jgi:hypothetical protein
VESKVSIFNVCRLSILSVFLIVICADSIAQKEPLKIEITADFQNVSLNDALRIIEKQLSIYFTFDGSIINTKKIINQKFVAIPLEKCLDQLLADSSLYYKVIENHVIIRCCKQFDVPKATDTEKAKILTLKGKVVDKISREPLAFASVGIIGHSIGIVTNNFGEFILKIPLEMENGELCVACLGYANLCISVNKLVEGSELFALERTYIPIQEVIIRKTDARNLIRNAIKSIPQNYSIHPVYFTGFYREAVNKGNNYMFVSEAVMQIYKSSYINQFDTDMVKILKTRKLQDLSIEDTLIVKLKSGLQASLGLDLMKNTADFLQEDNFNDYKYMMSDIVSIDNRNAYQIDFEPKENIEDAIFEGKIYIDIQSLAIVACEFNVNKKKISKNQSLFIAKKKKDISLKFTNISYQVSYRRIGNLFYLNYASGEINMKVRKRGKLFYFDFDIGFEMSISEMETQDVERFKRKDAARLHTIFFDEIYNYDEAFWEHYNFIKPNKPLQESIEKGIQK